MTSTFNLVLTVCWGIALSGMFCESHADFCSPDPCENNSTCVNATSSSTYSCECLKGWMGRNCSIVYNPCEDAPCGNGNCSIPKFPLPNQENLLQGVYICSCPPTYTGRNCSIALDACDSKPCSNQGVCTDEYDADINEASFSCKCGPSWTGNICNVTTEMSFVIKGAAKLTSPIPISASTSISFQVKTTHFDGVLVFLNSSNSSSPFSYSISLNKNYLILEIRESNQTTVITSDKELDPSVDWIPFSIRLDAANSSLEVSLGVINVSSSEAAIVESMEVSVSLSDEDSPFAGCLRDFRIDEGAYLLAGKDFEEEAKSSLVSGCRRKIQCDPNTCENEGVCTDLWNDFECQCKRPFFGKNCSLEIQPVTLGRNQVNQSSGDSFVFFNLSSADLASSGISVSLIFKTKAEEGLLFHLGAQDSSFLAAYLKDGSLIAAIGNSTEFVATTSASAVNNGEFHSMMVSLKDFSKLELVVDEKNRTEADASGIEAPKKEILYVGGMKKPSEGRKRRSAEKSDLEDVMDFKGVLQDPSFDGKRLLLTPQSGATSGIPSAEASPASNATITQGAQTDDVCALKSPCLNGGKCSNKDWQDFECDCAGLEYEGDKCQKRDPCGRVAGICPDDMECMAVNTDEIAENGDEGYYCVAVASFLNDEETMTFSSNYSAVKNFSFSFFLKTRSKKTQIAKIDLGTTIIEIEISEAGKLIVNRDGASMYPVVSGASVVSDAVCRKISMDEAKLTIQPANCSSGKLSGSSEVLNIMDAANATRITIEHVMVSLAPKSGEDSLKYEGCLRNVHLLGVALPIFEANKTKNEQKISFDRASSGSVSGSCIGRDVCGVKPCFQPKVNICEDEFNQFKCSCIEGFNGTRCENAMDMCQSNNPCVMNQTVQCYTGVNAGPPSKLEAKCECRNGYSEPKCADSKDVCTDNPCQHGGNCTDVGRGHFHCQCPPTHVGKSCHIPIPDKCYPKPCLNGGSCESGSGDVAFNCTCPTGFEGDICEYETCSSAKACGRGKKECVNNEWSNGGNTIIVGHTCFCKPGWEGTRCDRNVDECTRSPGICNSGECVDTDGSFQCQCNGTGYKGLNCEIEINECDDDPCKHGAACKNRPGFYECECAEGYRGVHCSDADCQLINCTGGKCVVKSDSDGAGTFWSCNCTGLGPHIEGDKCQDKHVCHEDTNPCDKVHSVKCNPGNETSEYECECKPGYEGTNCSQPINYCENINCSLLGNCTSHPDQQKYSCACEAGYNGTDCDNNIDDCHSIPCQNGGTCADLVNDFNCTCVSGWQGKNCSEDIKECDLSDVCNSKNNSSGNICNEKAGTFECKCNNTYGGDGCALSNACNSTVCNEGICEPNYEQPNSNNNPTSGISCNCSSTTFAGEFCQTPLPVIASSDDEIKIIVGVCVALALICLIVAVIVFFKSARSKRANRGTYSPSNQEIIGSRVEMGNLIKPPPEERLI